MLERGHTVHLAVRPNSALRTALGTANVHYHELGLRNALDVISAWQLTETIQREHIDILHAHVARDYTFCGIATRLAIKHEYPVRYFLTRHHYHPIKANPVYQWTLADVHKLIAVSKTVEARLHEAFPQHAERIEIVPNWVDLRRIGNLNRDAARHAMGLRRSWAIGLIGQLTPLKRQDLFLRAAQQLIRQRHWSDVDFVIVGAPDTSEADEHYAKSLRALANELGISEQVHFTGFVNDLPQRMLAFDVVVAPSDNEAFSLSIIEAMAAGCAVVATRVGGLAEIVEDEITGLLIEPDDMWGLVNALSRLLVDRHLRVQIGELASLTVRERYERERVIDRIEELYLEAV
jgi:glycosyltransferase involved in cell wall biosynthesis